MSLLLALTGGTDPIPVTPAPAGKYRRKPRYCVVIDGEEFEFDNEFEANALLAQALEVAQETAEATARKALARTGRRRAAPKAALRAPMLELRVHELAPWPAVGVVRQPEYDPWHERAQRVQALVDVANARIAELYRDAIRRLRGEQDDEDAVTLLVLGIL